MARPQSNQRGIETEIREEHVVDLVIGLNRTSVGLKPDPAAPAWRVRFGLNRTSVGLKQTGGAAGHPDPAGPQSNQRGIETE